MWWYVLQRSHLIWSRLILSAANFIGDTNLSSSESLYKNIGYYYHLVEKCAVPKWSH